MTGTEIREAIARLVAASARAEAFLDGAIYLDCEDGSADDAACADVRAAQTVALASTRPALSALAGMCVLDVEVVRELMWAGRAHWRCISCGPDDPTELSAALAAAEAEVRAVDGW